MPRTDPKTGRRRQAGRPPFPIPRTRPLAPRPKKIRSPASQTSRGAGCRSPPAVTFSPAGSGETPRPSRSRTWTWVTSEVGRRRPRRRPSPPRRRRPFPTFRSSVASEAAPRGTTKNCCRRKWRRTGRAVPSSTLKTRTRMQREDLKKSPFSTPSRRRRQKMTKPRKTLPMRIRKRTPLSKKVPRKELNFVTPLPDWEDPTQTPKKNLRMKTRSPRTRRKRPSAKMATKISSVPTR
mmetsp:Transcript_5414/g.11147  ORF Transcript_5414/g.11147 Transcript_5414/m.11147 type:complete len:236 (-) Transcript_5414:788-1495(-)